MDNLQAPLKLHGVAHQLATDSKLLLSSPQLWNNDKQKLLLVDGILFCFSAPPMQRRKSSYCEGFLSPLL